MFFSLTDEWHNYDVCSTLKEFGQTSQVIDESICVRNQKQRPHFQLQLPACLQHCLEHTHVVFDVKFSSAAKRFNSIHLPFSIYTSCSPDVNIYY